jgi:hypothetical protein
VYNEFGYYIHHLRSSLFTCGSEDSVAPISCCRNLTYSSNMAAEGRVSAHKAKFTSRSTLGKKNDVMS